MAITQVVLIDNICGKNRNETQNPPSNYKTMATRPEKAFFNHTTNNLWSAITNYGSVGDPNSPSTGRPSAQWPGGSGNNYLYDAGLWLGTKIGGEPVVTTYFYNPHVEYLPTSGFSGEMGAVISKDVHGYENTKSRSLEDSYVVFDDLEVLNLGHLGREVEVGRRQKSVQYSGGTLFMGEGGVATFAIFYFVANW